MQKEVFHESFPYPAYCNIEYLYKFGSHNSNHPEYTEKLLVEGELYHSRPDTFNDPFECKPFWVWPTNPNKVKAIRQYLIKLLVGNGQIRKQAEAIVSTAMKNRSIIESVLGNVFSKTYQEVRISCFTVDPKNLLFWSHYANSHKGFCLQFKTQNLPISSAFKVKYQDEYPEIQYPHEHDLDRFIPILTKSKHWKYEEEFRTLLVPGVELQPENDGESYILNGDEINEVYLGVQMENSVKDKVLTMLQRGPFSPKIFQVELSNSSFSVNFKEI